MDGFASTTTPARSGSVDPLVRWIAWGTMLVGSAIPEILCQKSRQDTPPWIPLTQCTLLLVVALVSQRSDRLRPLVRFILALTALWLGWYVVTPWLGTTEFVQHWSERNTWGARLMIARILPVSGALLMCVTLIGSGLSRADLFLRIGDLAAPAQPTPVFPFRKPISWMWFGPALLVVFGIALPLFLDATVRPNLATSHRIIQYLPWIIAVALLNAANEEFQFRNVLLAHLRNVITPSDAVLLTAIFFGVGHYYGQPSGPIGVVMAAFAGWIWARSMVETRGSGWAFSIHVVQDIVIFCFLAMATTG